MSNLLIVLSGPSGVGKGTIVSRLLKRGNYSLSVSCTTRPPREGEREGISYFFTDREAFLKSVGEGGFLEYSEHFGNLYGTPRKFVEQKLVHSDVILEIEVDGALQVKKSYPDALLIMIAPPDREALISRLRHRGSEDDSKIEERLKRMDYELSRADEYDYTVINDDLETAVEQIENIIEGVKKAK